MILKTSFTSYHNDRSGFLTPFTLMSRLWACPTIIKKKKCWSTVNYILSFKNTNIYTII